MPLQPLCLLPLALLTQVAPPSQAPIGRASVTSPAVASAPGIPGEAVPPLRIQVSDEAPPIVRADLDDGVPRAGTARVQAGPDGDRLISAADGDPFHLGFAAGNYSPPAGERIDPLLLTSVRAVPEDERPAPRVFAFALFERRITEERLDELRAAGATVLGFHPSSAVKVALAPESIDAVAHLPFVRWLGVARDWQKLHPRLGEQRAALAPGVALELYVNVFESDLGPETIEESLGTMSRVDDGTRLDVPQDPALLARRVHSRGWQERSLSRLGVEVLEYIDSVRAFRVRALPPAIERLQELDFVQFIERVEPSEALHHDSIPIVNSDFARYYLSGGSSQSVVAGQIDTGFDAAHADLNHVWGWGWGLSGTGGPWNDVCEHGSHVAGTFLGSGGVDPEYKGNAPGLGWGPAGRFYNVKVSDMCTGWSLNLASALGVLHTPIWDGSVSTPIPHVVNNSWGSNPGAWKGVETDARLVDADVYGLGQMYVFAAGNSGPGATTLSITASAKNAFTVGNVSSGLNNGVLPGLIEIDSSRGPTGDFRWKPNISAPGRWINSTDANSGIGHVFKGGTSMAAPHISGIAALVMDQISWLRYVPERLQSLLMATALAKDGALLTTPNDTNLRSYGTGRADVFRALFGTSQNGWSNWGTWLPANSYTWADFTIQPGCTRVAVCLHYVEPAASSGASQALISNFDLILDAPPIDAAFNLGDYYAQQSPWDNTEIRVLNNPTPGTWRWKIWPTNAPQGVYYGLTVMATYGATNPPVTVTTVPGKTFLKPFEATDVTVTVTNNNFVATNVVLEPQYAQYGGASANKVTKRLADLIIADDLPTGANVPLVLGNIPASGSRVSTYTTRWANEGQWGFISNVRGENVAPTSHMGVVTVDGTPPSTIANVTNSPFVPGVWNTQEKWTTFSWNAATDNMSGVAGYSVLASQGSVVAPDNLLETVGLNWASYLPSSATPWYFSVRAMDKCGNLGQTGYNGPYYVDAYPPTQAGGFTTSAHQVGVPSQNPVVSASWSASDAHSGVAGYAALWDDQPGTDPGFALTVTQGFLARTGPVVAPMNAWLHVRTLDVAGLSSAVAHYGPFPLVPFGAQVYCTAKLTGLGCTAQIGSLGTPVAYAGPDDFRVTAGGVNGQTSGVLLWGLGLVPPPVTTFGKPLLGHAQNGVAACVAGGGSLSGLTSGGSAGSCGGAFDVPLSEAWLAANGLTPGTSVYVQFVFSDPLNPDGTGVAHTDALQFVVAQ